LNGLEGRDNSEDLSADGKVILKWVLRKQGERVWTGFISVRIGTDGLL
jgi:hypothetical protein